LARRAQQGIDLRVKSDRSGKEILQYRSGISGLRSAAYGPLNGSLSPLPPLPHLTIRLWDEEDLAASQEWTSIKSGASGHSVDDGDSRLVFSEPLHTAEFTLPEGKGAIMRGA
jgi:hypothetical protein